MEDETRKGGAPGPRRFALPLAYAVLLLGYLAALAYFAPPGLLLSRQPVSGQELDARVVQAYRVGEALAHGGHTWEYDPQLLAGCPQGVLFDSDDKAWELWTFALAKLGVAKGTAFNLFIAAVHLLVPFALLAAAALFGLRGVGRLALVALGLLVWCFDSALHWAWWNGAVSWAAVSYLCLVPLGLFHRFTERGRLKDALALAPILGAVHLVHPYAFFVLAAPMTALYVRRFRALGARQHAAVAGIVAVTLAVNAWWILVDLRFWRYLLGTDGLGASTLFNLVTDYVGIVADRADSGAAGMRSGWRFLALALAAVSLWYWRRERDRRFLPFAVGLAALAALAYLGGYAPPLRQLQPYRFVGPLAFLACVPAAHLVERAWAAEALRRLPARVYVVAAIAIAVALPRLVRDALYFLPPLIPRVEELADEKPQIADFVGFSDLGYPRHPEFRYKAIAPENQDVVDWVAQHLKAGAPGRVAVESWTLGEQLMWKTRAEVLGGYRLRNLAHTAADFFRAFPRDPPPDGMIRAFVKRYAVRYVISSLTHQRFLDSPSLLAKVAEFGPHKIFESRLEPSYFAEGSGRVEAKPNRISVRGTKPAEALVLRYHWLETLACAPSCRIGREPLKGDPVGFIRVAAGHPVDFEIVNGY